MISISVVIPTYRRPDDLKKCLEALKKQTRTPDQTIVVIRNTDLETRSFVEDYNSTTLSLCIANVTNSGQVAALNAGLEEATGDIIAITDDDGVPHRHWLEKIEAHFYADPELGGLGGKDWMYVGDRLVTGEEKTVGKVQWFGRTIGNHHLGVGRPREVEILKGANMSYRRDAISNLRFDHRLLGTGAEVHNDLAFSLNVKKAGWKLLYDPEVEIDHYHGQRFDEDVRGTFNKTAWFNEVHNDTLVLLDYLSFVRRNIYLIWTILVGTRKGYGLVQLLRFLPKEGMLSGIKWWLTMKARWQGWLTHQRTSSRNDLSVALQKEASSISNIQAIGK